MNDPQLNHAPESPHFLDTRATITLIVVSLTLFLLELSGRDLAVLKLGSNTLAAAPYAVFTTTLLHAGGMHLAFNIMWTYDLGRVVEWRFGTLVFLLLLVVTSAPPMLAEWVMNGPGVGLSGIVYGFAGFLWAAGRCDPRYEGLLSRGVTRLLIGWFFVCIALTISGVLPVANWAHGVGALLGALLGWAVVAPRPLYGLRWVALSLSATLPLIALLTIGQQFGGGGDWTGLYNAGTRALSDSRPADALPLFERAVEKNPEFANAWHNLGIARLRTGDREGALEALRNAYEINPQDGFTRQILKAVESGELEPTRD